MPAQSAFLNDLRRNSPDDCVRVIVGIKNTIEDSFVEDRRGSTRREVTRRFEMCLRLAGMMVMELGWSVSRALDTLPFALRIELEGGTWTPRVSSTWVGNERVEVGSAEDLPLLWTPERQRRGVVVL